MGETRDRLIPIDEVARFYSVNEKTARRWSDDGRIPKPVVNRHRFTRWSENEIAADVERIKNGEMAEAAS